jgi:hypothetical protein
MKELVNVLMSALLYTEFLPVLVGIFTFKKFKNTYWKWFFVYLVFIFTTGLAKNMVDDLLSLKNNDFYIFFVIPIEFLFFYWLYAYQSLKNKTLFYAFTIIYLTSFVANIFLEVDYLLIYSFNYVVGAFLIAILVFLEYKKQIRSDEILEFKKNMMFYVNLGVSLLYVGTLPLFSFYTILLKDAEIFYGYYALFLVVNHLMYILFSLAFLWGKPNTY